MGKKNEEEMTNKGMADMVRTTDKEGEVTSGRREGGRRGILKYECSKEGQIFHCR